MPAAARPMSANAAQRMGATFAKEFTSENVKEGGILGGIIAGLLKKLIEMFIASLLKTHDIVPKEN